MVHTNDICQTIFEAVNGGRWDGCFALDQAGTQQQRDAVSDEWRDRFLRDGRKALGVG